VRASIRSEVQIRYKQGTKKAKQTYTEQTIKYTKA